MTRELRRMTDGGSFMSKIKIIKKNELTVENHPFKTVEGNPQSRTKQRQTIETVESWIVDWRERTASKTRRALDELTRLKLRNSSEM
jgi:hypothetical protein